jgi:hypothetical protein
MNEFFRFIASGEGRRMFVIAVIVIIVTATSTPRGIDNIPFIYPEHIEGIASVQRPSALSDT